MISDAMAASDTYELKWLTRVRLEFPLPLRWVRQDTHRILLHTKTFLRSIDLVRLLKICEQLSYINC